MTATFLLIRHARHEDLGIRLSGRRPGVPLTAQGQAEAAALGGALKSAKLDRIACSPLERTSTTAQAIADACGLAPPEPMSALMEIDFGEWTGREFHELEADAAWQRWNAQRDRSRPPGGETMAAAQARIADWLAEEAKRSDGCVVAAVTHCDMIRAAVAHVLGLSLDKLLRFDIDPASITTIVAGDWGARLVRLNERGE